MKQLLKKILEYKLRFYAKKILKKYNPDIIGITGSVGKTSAKEAIYCVLKDKMTVRKSEKNYNNEIGVPLTIIGVESGKKSISGWFKVFSKAQELLRKNCDFPKVIILEMGADHHGDIEYLMSFVSCKIGVVTSVGEAHIQYFGSLKNISKEKRKLIESLSERSFAILNADDEYVYDMRKISKAKIHTIGFSENSEIRASEVRIGGESKNGFGTSFKLSYGKSIIPISLIHVLGEHFIYSALFAVAIGKIYGIPIIEIARSLQSFQSPVGRMRSIEGIKNTKIIDDTYNASPQAVIAALKLIKTLGAKRKIAVLGDMLELGSFTEKEHYNVGKKVPEMGIDTLITVGEKSRDIARGARDAKMSKDHIFSFENTHDAGKFLQNRLEEGDLILVKGSQGARMEKVVKEVMAEPLRARELLCRQAEEWLNRA